MGCISTKQSSVSVRPSFDCSGAFRENVTSVSGCHSQGKPTRLPKPKNHRKSESDNGGSEFGSSRIEEPLSCRLGNLQKQQVEGEQAAAGWPSWLSAVAGEAIQGWVPLKADSFEKLEKIGQGTYSSVFRAREIETGKIFALKKVRFDNFEPESVRFMSREIMILRKLDHPNIMKLEGLITSRISSSVYLVFEYMEHDLTGLSSSPDIKFSESQVKCYMHQLLSGLQHCHSKGVMHRDIKGSNLLINNEGVLKLADFGLANYVSRDHKQPLTSRVVTLWYRPPELLLGSTDYGEYVDLWSVGCVFAELLLGKPLLKGRTEVITRCQTSCTIIYETTQDVEQLHKIFKLCGSPSDEYWKKSKLPHATAFKPNQSYESCLSSTCKDFPTNAVNLIQTFLSIEPHKRGSASSALASKYFTTKPYACHPSTLPKYPPNKEIDAKNRSDLARRKRANGRARRSEASRRRARISTNPPNKFAAPSEEFKVHIQRARKTIDCGHLSKEVSDTSLYDLSKPSIDMIEEEAFHVEVEPQEDFCFSGPLQVATSSGFAWAARNRKEDPTLQMRSSDLKAQELGVFLYGSRINLYGSRINSKEHNAYEIAKHEMQKRWDQLERLESLDASSNYRSHNLSMAAYQREEMATKRSNLDEGNRVELSGPLFSQSFKVDDLLERRERHIRQASQKSRFPTGRRHNLRAM